MANTSTAQKLGVAARIAGEQVKRSRTFGALVSGARATLSHFGSVLHQLWLEVTGFVFLVRPYFVLESAQEEIVLRCQIGPKSAIPQLIQKLHLTSQ